jgi:hypothetical protein
MQKFSTQSAHNLHKLCTNCTNYEQILHKFCTKSAQTIFHNDLKDFHLCILLHKFVLVFQVPPSRPLQIAIFAPKKMIIFLKSLRISIPIWSTFSRNDFPLKISWCFPKKVVSLVFLGVLIFYAIEPGSVLFIKS